MSSVSTHRRSEINMYKEGPLAAREIPTTGAHVFNFHSIPATLFSRKENQPHSFFNTIKFHIDLPEQDARSKFLSNSRLWSGSFDRSQWAPIGAEHWHRPPYCK